MTIIFAILFGAIVFSHMAPFPFLMEAFRPSQSLWRVPQPNGGRAIYLTFDDGPNVDWTPRVLDALNESGATATFFLIDQHVTPETEPIVRRMAADGHAIGLHSGTRKLMVESPEALAAHLSAAALRIERVTGRPPCRLFRPHAGWRSAGMYEGLAKIDYRLAGWSWGMWDWSWWRTPDATSVARRLDRKASPGDIIVIHDGHHKDPRADRRHAGAAVRLLVPALKGKGYSFGKLCDERGGGN